MFAKRPGQNRIKTSRKLKITIRKYEIPTDDSYDNNFNPLIELKPDMVKEREDRELETTFKLTEVSQEVANYNSRQIIISKKLKKSTIYQKRITKN